VTNDEIALELELLRSRHVSQCGEPWETRADIGWFVLDHFDEILSALRAVKRHHGALKASVSPMAKRN
jgi:hypothetical protein